MREPHICGEGLKLNWRGKSEDDVTESGGNDRYPFRYGTLTMRANVRQGLVHLDRGNEDAPSVASILEDVL